MRRVVTAAAAIAILGGCAALTTDLTEPEPMPGTYVMTTYAAGPNAADRMDMIALGVRWTLEVAGDNAVVSTMWVAQDTVATPVPRSGKVRRVGNEVTFYGFSGWSPILTQRTWTLSGNELAAVNQTVDGVSSTIRFTRQ